MAAVVSMLLARGLKLPELQWAPIATIVILLSTVNPLTQAWQRFVGTALGAAMGALIASFFPPNWMVYGIGIFVGVILSAVLRLGGASRFTAITMTIVLLTVQGAPPWTIGLQRFVEVSLGIAVALLTTLLWRGPKSG